LIKVWIESLKIHTTDSDEDSIQLQKASW